MCKYTNSKRCVLYTLQNRLEKQNPSTDILYTHNEHSVSSSLQTESILILFVCTKQCFKILTWNFLLFNHTAYTTRQHYTLHHNTTRHHTKKALYHATPPPPDPFCVYYVTYYIFKASPHRLLCKCSDTDGAWYHRHTATNTSSCVYIF